MGGPAWLTAIFAAASLAVAVYCAGRLVVARRGHRPTELDTDGAHVIMGVAMAGMLVSGLRTLPSAIWEVVFAAAAVWFGYRMLQARRGAQPSPWRSSHPLPHLVECAAMVFMFLILPASAAVRGHGRHEHDDDRDGVPLLVPDPAAGPVPVRLRRLARRPRDPARPRPRHRDRPGQRRARPRSAAAAAQRPRSPTSPPAAPRSARSPWASPWATC